MDWKEVGKKLINIGAPILGTAIGGPAGGIAAKAAISLIGAKAGIAEESLTPEIVTNALADPNFALKLKEAELNHSVEIERLIIEDRKSEREENTKKHSKELETKTIPWVDALHKMGRQILNLLVVIATVVLMLSGKTITPEVALLLGGGNVAYQLIKRVGK